MKRYTPNLWRVAGEPYLSESEDGEYVLAQEVIEVLENLSKEADDLRIDDLDTRNIFKYIYTQLNSIT